MKMTNESRGKLLWVLAIVGFALTIPTALMFPCDCFVGELLYNATISIPIILVTLHAVWKLGTKRGLFLLSFASFCGFVAEWFGLRLGGIFGGTYEYAAEQVAISRVPVNVIAFWAVFIYLGYSITSGFLEIAGISKPHYPIRKQLLILSLMVILDALIVTGLDLFMDPIQVHLGNWRWLDSGSYFDIPTGNFIGWFSVTAITTGIFRLYEYLKPAQFDRISMRAELIPAVAYIVTMFSLGVYAYLQSMTDLLMIGIFIMLPISLASIILYVGGIFSPRSYHYEK